SAALHAKKHSWRQRSALPERNQKTTDHGDRNRPAPASQEHHQLVFTPSWVLLAQLAHAFRLLRTPSRAAPAHRPMRTVFQSGQLLRIVAPLPAIEGLTADAEVSTGQGGVPAVSLVVIEPSQPLLSFTAQLGYALPQVPGAGDP